MGRIEQDELDRIKREVSVADLARRRGVELKPHGKDLIGLCPFHNDHEPSLVITPEKNLWHCLGACQAGGDVIEWVKKAEGVKFRHAVELLRRHDVALGSSHAKVVKSASVKKLPSPVALDADDHETLHQVVAYYHETLKDSPDALAYLEKRKINHPEALDTFKLGYANRTIGYRLPFSAVKAGRELRTRLMNLGIYRRTGHEHLAGSVVVPVFDESGHVTELYGRKIRDDLRPGTAYHLYLPGPHKGVWNVSALSASREVILCEALIDALSFWCAGFRNVTASYGVEGFTPDHLDAFKRYGIEKVLVAYDRDDAGDRAAAKLAPFLIENGFEVLRVEFPQGEDANSVACAAPDPASALGAFLHAAAWIGRPRAVVVASEVAAKEDLPLAAPPAPPRPADPPGQMDETFEGRAWRVRGLDKNTVYGVLKVSLRVSSGDRFHMDTVDLASARLRALFLKAAAQETNLPEAALKDDLRNLLLKLEDAQDALIQKKLKPPDPAATLTDLERDEALAFLKLPDLLDRITQDFERVGIVGESTNLLTGYLAATSRKLDAPLDLLIQSTSAAGKTAVMDAILSLMPPEDVVRFSAMTGQALFYLDDVDLRHKILAIAEEEGAQKAGFAIKLLMTDGKLVIASTMKDPQTGNWTARQREKEGPTMVMMTTTNLDVAEELANRMLVETVNEDREQTRKIHVVQRESQTLEGLLKRSDRADVRRRHHNAQRLLRPLLVANPYARQLTFLDTCLRTRRDHMKYLTLIRAVALLHQYQRPVKQATIGGHAVSYIEATPADIERANQLADEVLGRSLDDLPAPTRRLLIQLDDLVSVRCDRERLSRADVRFTRRDVRDHTALSDTQVKVHMRKLEDLEYVLIHRGRRGISFEYELLYDGRVKDGRKFCMGLIDVSALKAADPLQYDTSLAVDNGGFAAKQADFTPPKRPQVGRLSAGCRVPNFAAILTASKASRSLLKNWAKTHIVGGTLQNRRRIRISAASL